MESEVTNLKVLAQNLGLEYQERIESVQPVSTLRFGEFSKVVGAWGKFFQIVPIREDESAVFVAACLPTAYEQLDTLRFCFQKPIEVVVAPEAEIARIINNLRASLMSDRESSLAGEQDGDNLSTSLKIDVTDAEDDDAPIIRYVNTLIFRAANERASDIHIEPFEANLKVRFRIDGVLHDVDSEDKFFQAAIISRIKVMASLDIAEKRLPQDGRIGLKIAGQDVDIRVSTVPTRYGERIVMRLLDKSKVALDLTSLGLAEHARSVVETLVKKTHGIILVTGPTGSGKTTTLYACLSQINSEDKNILTVEDPVEYELKGIGQMQVNPKIDFTFANGLRSILRQDPDVIMVGEIRDLETVEIAIQASLTGHLVFSTLHTNDAPGAITRLLDMGVEPFLISSSLLAIMAQRLIRKLCPSCKAEYPISEHELAELAITDKKLIGKKVYRALGCKRCQGTGYAGRSGIHELLLVTDEVRESIMNRANASQIRQTARSMTSLRADGAAKIFAGITSVEEVLRVTQDDIV